MSNHSLLHKKLQHQGEETSDTVPAKGPKPKKFLLVCKADRCVRSSQEQDTEIKCPVVDFSLQKATLRTDRQQKGTTNNTLCNSSKNNKQASTTAAKRIHTRLKPHQKIIMRIKKAWNASKATEKNVA